MVPRLPWFPGSHPLGTLGGSLGTMKLRINYSPTPSGEKLALAVDFIYKKGLFHNKQLSLPEGINYLKLVRVTASWWKRLI